MSFVATLLRTRPRNPAPADPPPQIQDFTISKEIKSAFEELCTSVYLNFSSKYKPLDSENINNAKVVEILITDPTGVSGIQIRALRGCKELKDFEDKYNVDVVLQPETVYRKHKRLVVFDMDSTLIEQEVIDEIAAFVGVKDKVAGITERAMKGELDFSSSLRERCFLLKGVSANVFETLKSDGTITFTPGAHALCASLKTLGCKLAVLSGGFQPLAEFVKQSLGLDYAFANTLEVSPDGKSLTGNVLGEIVNAERKAYLLREIARKEGIKLEQVVAVGDGANDLVMMREAGFGVAFMAKPVVQKDAPAKVNRGDLRDVMYLFGFSEREVRELGEEGVRTKV